MNKVIVTIGTILLIICGAIALNFTVQPGECIYDSFSNNTYCGDWGKLNVNTQLTCGGWMQSPVSSWTNDTLNITVSLGLNCSLYNNTLVVTNTTCPRLDRIDYCDFNGGRLFDYERNYTVQCPLFPTFSAIEFVKAGEVINFSKYDSRLNLLCINNATCPAADPAAVCTSGYIASTSVYQVAVEQAKNEGRNSLNCTSPSPTIGYVATTQPVQQQGIDPILIMVAIGCVATVCLAAYAKYRQKPPTNPHGA